MKSPGEERQDYSIEHLPEFPGYRPALQIDFRLVSPYIYLVLFLVQILTDIHEYSQQITEGIFTTITHFISATA